MVIGGLLLLIGATVFFIARRKQLIM
ncbi:LPXTG cell wall anchor domain-containing protein [Alkalihalobacillus alcalophilus]